MSIRGSLPFLLGLAVALGLGWIAFPRVLYRTESQPLQFNHKLHASDKVGSKCADCHTLGADGSFAVPALDACAGCHSEPVTQNASEKLLVEKYVKPNRPIPWFVYARQPANVRFPHAIHMERAKLKCERCHGGHGASESLRPYEENRISGYSRDVWGRSISRIVMDSSRPAMKMDDCAACHRDHRVDSSCLDCHK
jgi:hypothetical protein